MTSVEASMKETGIITFQPAVSIHFEHPALARQPHIHVNILQSECKNSFCAHFHNCCDCAVTVGFCLTGLEANIHSIMCQKDFKSPKLCFDTLWLQPLTTQWWCGYYLRSGLFTNQNILCCPTNNYKASKGKYIIFTTTKNNLIDLILSWSRGSEQQCSLSIWLSDVRTCRQKMQSLLVTCQWVGLNMESVVAGDFKTEMRNVFLHSTAPTARLLVLSLLLMKLG